MNEKFDEEAFLKATNLGEETAVKDAEATERESQRSSDEKQKLDYAKEVASVENQHEETAKDLTRKKKETRVRCEAANDKLASLEAQLNSSEVLAPAFQYLAPAIKTILETGRADSVKEALNLAISEEKDERERQARREHERTMEEIATQESEEAADTEMKAFESQTRARKKRESEEDERQREKDQEEKERQEEEDRTLKTATFFHCSECAKYAGCPPARTKYGLNCTAFQQKEKFKL